MSFVKKTYSEIYQTMEDQTRQMLPELSDFQEGSVIRSLYESFAYEMAILYEQLDLVYQSGFIDSATGTDLDHIVAVLGASRNEPDFATGEVTFSRDGASDEAMTIPSGTLVTTEDEEISMGDGTSELSRKAYVTTLELTLQAGVTEGTVPIKAEDAGSDKVTDAGTIIVMPTPVPGIEAVTNQEPVRFLGRDLETDAELVSRTKQILLGSGNASTTAIKNALLSLPGIRQVAVQEVFDDPNDPDNSKNFGRIKVYVDGLTTDNTKNLQDKIDQVRSAGVFCELFPAEKIYIIWPQTQITYANPYVDQETKQQIQNALYTQITTYVDSLDMGTPLLNSQLLKQSLAVEGIDDINFGLPEYTQSSDGPAPTYLDKDGNEIASDGNITRVTISVGQRFQLVQTLYLRLPFLLTYQPDPRQISEAVKDKLKEHIDNGEDLLVSQLIQLALATEGVATATLDARPLVLTYSASDSTEYTPDQIAQQVEDELEASSGDLRISELIQLAESIEGVAAATLDPLPLVLTYTDLSSIEPNPEQINQWVEDNLRAYIDNLPLGEELLISQLIQLAEATEGVLAATFDYAIAHYYSNQTDGPDAIQTISQTDTLIRINDNQRFWLQQFSVPEILYVALPFTLSYVDGLNESDKQGIYQQLHTILVDYINSLTEDQNLQFSQLNIRCMDVPGISHAELDVTAVRTMAQSTPDTIAVSSESSDHVAVASGQRFQLCHFSDAILYVDLPLTIDYEEDVDKNTIHEQLYTQITDYLANLMVTASDMQLSLEFAALAEQCATIDGVQEVILSSNDVRYFSQPDTALLDKQTPAEDNIVTTLGQRFQLNYFSVNNINVSLPLLLTYNSAVYDGTQQSKETIHNHLRSTIDTYLDSLPMGGSLQFDDLRDLCTAVEGIESVIIDLSKVSYEEDGQTYENLQNTTVIPIVAGQRFKRVDDDNEMIGIVYITDLTLQVTYSTNVDENGKAEARTAVQTAVANHIDQLSTGSGLVFSDLENLSIENIVGITLDKSKMSYIMPAGEVQTVIPDVYMTVGGDTIEQQGDTQIPIESDQRLRLRTETAIKVVEQQS
jgi:uncharacterized phage protein gp47/JayE